MNDPGAARPPRQRLPPPRSSLLPAVHLTQGTRCRCYASVPRGLSGHTQMLTFILWLLLLVLCWPLALLALLLYPIVWLILLPFRLLGIAVDGVLALLRAVIRLPARVLGGRA